jgi:hypothetical protein
MGKINKVAIEAMINNLDWLFYNLKFNKIVIWEVESEFGR